MVRAILAKLNAAPTGTAPSRQAGGPALLRDITERLLRRVRAEAEPGRILDAQTGNSLCAKHKTVLKMYDDGPGGYCPDCKRIY